MRRNIRFVGTILLLLAACVAGIAQTVSGDLTGTIYDQSGATVPGATITARNTQTGVDSTTKSTNTGEYRIANLAVGTYTVTVTAAGFSKAEVKGVQVELNKANTNNIKLDVGQSVETVEVTSSSATIDTTTAQVQNTFQSAQVMDLPTASSGSGVINLSLLNAGVASSGGIGVGTGPSVGGQRPRNNNFTIEGIDNNDTSVTGPLVNVPNDAVQEFTVLQNQFTPDFGHSSGGQFNQVVKSGGNEIHGMAYEYLGNRNLNAADNLSFIEQNPLHPRFDDNRFGGNIGGPIRKNKLFFFANYEYEPVGLSGSGGTVFAPTAAGYSALAGIPGINQTSLGILKQYLGTAATAVSPADTPGEAYPIVGPGNQGLGAVAKGVTIPLGQLSVNAPSFKNYERAVASFDDTISEKDSLRFRFILNRSGAIDTAASLSTFYTTTPANSYIATISEFHSFAPNLMNEFRAGYNRYYYSTPAGNFTWPGLDQFPNINIFELGVQLGPDGNAPQYGTQNTYQLTDNVTWTHGNHSFKFGFDGNKLISPQSFTQRSRGDYEWDYLSDFLFDYYPDYLAQRSVGSSIFYGDRILAGMYMNDSWKVKPNLTINLGLRYEYETVSHSKQLQTLNAISSVPGLVTFGAPQPDPHDFMPRIGIAYSPGTSGRTSIRGGFGINYDVLYDNQGLNAKPPQSATTADVTGLDLGGFLAHGGIPGNVAGGPALSQAAARAGTGGYYDLHDTRPRSIQWNIGVQHVFAKNYTVESRYLGTRGVHLSVQDQINRIPVVTAANALPVYFSAPTQATLNGLTSTLASLNSALGAGANNKPAWLAAGFTSPVTAYEPWGNSTYHGWANQFNRRFDNGLQFQAAYTFSHNIDDSTADVFSTYLTPRRAQDSNNLRAERASSALDHRNRLTVEVLYDVHPFTNSNWLLKNIVGNWTLAPVYTYQTGTWYTVQAGPDSNLNGDSAPDRAILNPSGDPNAGSGTKALTNSAGATVAYLVTNPNAGYVATPKGALANVGRNTMRLHPIDDVDITVSKNLSLGKENVRSLRFEGRFFNIFNHPQYAGGFINDVAPVGFTDTTSHNFLIPSTSIFNQPSQAFSSNPRNIQLSAKFTF